MKLCLLIIGEVLWNIDQQLFVTNNNCESYINIFITYRTPWTKTWKIKKTREEHISIFVFVYWLYENYNFKPRTCGSTVAYWLRFKGFYTQVWGSNTEEKTYRCRLSNRLVYIFLTTIICVSKYLDQLKNNSCYYTFKLKIKLYSTLRWSWKLFRIWICVCVESKWSICESHNIS